MHIKDIRLTRLRQIIEDRFDGNQGQCADALEIKRPQMSRWVTRNESARQGIAEDSARFIEEKLGYPAGWMDSEKTTYRAAAEEPVIASAYHHGGNVVSAKKPKSRREKEIETIRSILETMDDRGLAIMLNKAKEVAVEYPALKQTPQSSS